MGNYKAKIDDLVKENKRLKTLLGLTELSQSALLHKLQNVQRVSKSRMVRLNAAKKEIAELNDDIDCIYFHYT